MIDHHARLGATDHHGEDHDDAPRPRAHHTASRSPVILLQPAAEIPGFGSIVGVVFPLLTILAIGGCTLLYGITTTLRTSNGDLRDRVKDLEDEDKAKDAKLTAQADQIAGQKGELEALRRVVTGEVHLVAITDLLTEHHGQAVKEWEIINGTLGRIDTTMSALLVLAREKP